MREYEFRFNNGTAEIVELATGNTVLVQPFNPSPSGQQPWASAEEAEAWMQIFYPSLFADIEDVPASEAPTDETQPTGE